jgi:hypothetical protein
MRRHNYMVRLAYRDSAGETRVALSDRRARSPQEAIRRAIRAEHRKNPRSRICGAAAHQYVVL